MLGASFGLVDWWETSGVVYCALELWQRVTLCVVVFYGGIYCLIVERKWTQTTCDGSRFYQNLSTF